MKLFAKKNLFALLAGILAGGMAGAQTTNGTRVAQPATTVTPTTDTATRTEDKTTLTSPERIKAPERTAVVDYTEGVKRLVEDAKMAERQFLEEQKTLQNNLVRASTEEERAKVREQIQAVRANFLATQRDTREDIQKRMTELKDQLKNHRDLLQEEVKQRARERKGGKD